VDAGRVLVDGTPGAQVGALDRGLAFGDGVFRTLRVAAGRPLNWARHYERLRVDCALLELPLPAEALLLRELQQVAPGDAIAKIILTRGAGGRGYRMPLEADPTRVVAAFDPVSHPPAWASEGVTVRRCLLVLSEQPRFAGAKTLNRLENVLARAEWDDPQVAEGLLCDAAGRVIEGTMSNVFMVKGGVVTTPSLARCGVAGAQRARVMDLLGARGLRAEVRDLRYDELAAADEIFLTNSVIGAWPVTALENTRYKVGAITRLVQRAIEKEDAGD
jgi:4-amino-4-deoxychorismate lyase